MSASRLVNVRLSVMMFLEFFVWGLWFVTLGLVLTRRGLGSSIGDAFSTGPVASLVSPVILGLVVDRFVASQNAMAILHLIGAGLLWLVPSQIDSGNSHALITLLLLYMLCYMPTVALANNVTFHALGENRGSFPFIRVFGTVGWVFAGVGIGQTGLSDSPQIFYIAAAASIFLGLYSFSLPETPPPLAGRAVAVRDLLCFDAFRMLRERNFLIFGICSTLIAIPLATYYAYASPFIGAMGFKNVGTIMALGQMSETGFMLLIPLCLRRFGVKLTLLVGMATMAVRYVLFAASVSDVLRPMVFLGVALHGVCYDFFFVVAFMYTDRVAGPNVKGQGQGLIVMLTYGLGLLLGSQLSSALYASITETSPVPTLGAWQNFWWWPAATAALVAIVFAALFRPVADQFKIANA